MLASRIALADRRPNSRVKLLVLGDLLGPQTDHAAVSRGRFFGGLAERHAAGSRHEHDNMEQQ